jgi:polysaccharide biosynthesis transport protein
MGVIYPLIAIVAKVNIALTKKTLHSQASTVNRQQSTVNKRITKVSNTSLNQRELLSSSPQNTVDIKQVAKILVRQRLLIFSVSCLVVSGASLLALTAKPSYQSTMELAVSSNEYDGMHDSNQTSDLDREITKRNFSVIDYTAQLKLMQSTALIQKAVNLLRAEYPKITVEYIKGKKGEIAPLVIVPVDEGTKVNTTQNQVFEISFQDSNPIKTQKVLQALQKVYQNYNVEQQKQRLNHALAFVNDKLPQIKKELSEAEHKLDQFRKKNNLVDPELQSKMALESLADVSKQLQTTRAQLKDVQARYLNLQKKLAESPKNAAISSRLNQSNRYQALLNEIQKTESALATERQRYTDDTPIVQQLIQQRKSQVELLRQEAGKNIGGKTTSKNTSQPLMTQEQQEELEIKLAQELIEVQTKAIGLDANEKSLAESENKLRLDLSRYSNLIAEYNRLLPEVTSKRRTLEQLLETQQSLVVKVSQSGFNWQILEEAQAGIYLGGGGILTLVMGMIVAPLVGISAALIWELMNDAIYAAHDLQQLTNKRLLGKVPKLKSRRLPKKMPILAWNKLLILEPDLLESIAGLQFDESFDMINQNIQIMQGSKCKSLLLTSTIASEGTSTIILGLAVSAVKMHKRVLIIDANMRHPSLHKTLGLSNDWGLSLLLVDESNTPIKEYIQPVHPSIDILTSGPAPEDSVKLLTSQRMKEVIDFCENNYDLVLIDAPAVLSVVDARILASLSEGIIMVGRIGHVTKNEVIQAGDILSEMNLIGVVANCVNK